MGHLARKHLLLLLISYADLTLSLDMTVGALGTRLGLVPMVAQPSMTNQVSSLK